MILILHLLKLNTGTQIKVFLQMIIMWMLFYRPHMLEHLNPSSGKKFLKSATEVFEKKWNSKNCSA